MWRWAGSAGALVLVLGMLAGCGDATPAAPTSSTSTSAGVPYTLLTHLRDLGDLAGAEHALEHSVATRKTLFAHTHAVTLGYLGAVQARQGELDRACETWSMTLDAMDGVQSARARQTVVDLRVALRPHRDTYAPATELDDRAAAHLATVG